jgi:hypothetical protein
VAGAGDRALTDRWTRVNDLFHRALAEPADRRAHLLAEWSEGDEALAKDVLSLVDAHERAGGAIEAAANASHSIDPPPSLRTGQIIGSYTIRSVLGTGGMGVVYLAEDKTLGRDIALKALAPRLTNDQKGRERLRREARAAASLSHPNIATVYALEEIGGSLYLASEYVPGETLRDQLRQGPLPTTRVIDTGRALASALAAAHDRGIVHRDLKPENVMRTPSGQIKVLDFGVARFLDAADDRPSQAPLTGDGFVLGTPAYMSPEQLRGQPVDVRSDLFSLGIVLYELLTGVHPFGGRDPASTIARILERDAPPIPVLPDGNVDGTRDGLAGVIQICLAKSPGARFQTATALLRALEGVASGSNAINLPRPAPAAALWWWQFHQAATCVAYAAVLYPLWLVRGWTGGTRGQWFFLAALAAVLISMTLRLHLWFTVRSYPGEWHVQRQRAFVWIRLADVALVGLLGLGTAMTLPEHTHLSIALVVFGVAILLSFAIIEPATERAAFRIPLSSSAAGTADPRGVDRTSDRP